VEASWISIIILILSTIKSTSRMIHSPLAISVAKIRNKPQSKIRRGSQQWLEEFKVGQMQEWTHSTTVVFKHKTSKTWFNKMPVSKYLTQSWIRTIQKYTIYNSQCANQVTMVNLISRLKGILKIDQVIQVLSLNTIFNSNSKWWTITVNSSKNLEVNCLVKILILTKTSNRNRQKEIFIYWTTRVTYKSFDNNYKN
jgi:hypothetical protein